MPRWAHASPHLQPPAQTSVLPRGIGFERTGIVIQILVNCLARPFVPGITLDVPPVAVQVVVERHAVHDADGVALRIWVEAKCPHGTGGGYSIRLTSGVHQSFAWRETARTDLYPFHTQVRKSTFSQTFKEKYISQVVRIGSIIIILRVSQLWEPSSS